MFKRTNYRFEQKSCNDKLEVTIPKLDADKIKLTLDTIGKPTPYISANQLLAQLRSGMTPIFRGLEIFLSLVEGVKIRSYRIYGRMTIGIGLDLENSEAEAVIIATNKKFGLSLNYKDLRDNEERPINGLEPDQINYMLWLALVGVTEKRPDGSTVTFPSHTQGLVNLLNKNCGDGFADIPFKANQLIALQSMVYNAGVNTDLIGKNLCAGLRAILKTGDDTAALEQILEYSNRKKEVGIANRRLIEAGLFHGDPSAKEIHSYWRPYKRIQPSIFPRLAYGDPTDDLPHYPLPSGLQHQTFVGNSSVVVIPGPDDAQLDTTVLGSNRADRLTATNSSSVLLGGDGDDILSVPDFTVTTNYTPRYPYLAGNNGFDTYSFGFYPGHVLIYDADRQGQVVQKNLTLRGVVYGGQLKLKDRVYKFSRTKNPDNTYWTNANWGDLNNDIYIRA